MKKMTGKTEQPRQSPQSFRQWGPVTSLIVTVFGFVIAQIFAIIIFLILAAVLGWNGQTASDRMQSVPWLTFSFGLVVYGGYLLIIRSYLHWSGHRLKEVGLRKPRSWLETVGYILIAYVIYFLVIVVAMALVSRLMPAVDLDQKQNLGIDMNTTGLGLIPIFLTLVVLPPVVEEIVTRGFLYTGLRRKLNVLWAGLFTSIVFGAAHLEWGGDAPLLWAAAIDTFVLSWILIYLREKTGSLAACIGVHMLKNGMAFLALFVLRLG